MYNFCTYRLFCKTTQRSYIGKTKADPSARWADHIKTSNASSDKKKYPIHFALAKYGIDDFEFSIIQLFKNLKKKRTHTAVSCDIVPLEGVRKMIALK